MQGKHLYVGPIGFHGRPPSGDAADFTGYMITPGGLQGVRGGVGVSSESLQRPGAHGEFDLPVFKQARVVTVGGSAIESNEDALEQLGIVLGGLGAGGESMPLVYHGAGLVIHGRGRMVSQEFEPDFRRIGGGRSATTYSLSLSMRDPRWYGAVHESVSTGGNVATTNRGNFSAHQRFRVEGNMPGGYWLSGRGRIFEVPGPLPPGRVDLVDFRTGVVKRNGVPVAGVVPRTWDVPGGGTVQWALTPFGSGSGTATSYLAATYI